MLQLSFLAIFHNCRHSSSPCQSIKLYKNLTYALHAPRGYRIKLQRQKYTEWRTIIIIELTSVGLAHARPNPNPLPKQHKFSAHPYSAAALANKLCC